MERMSARAFTESDTDKKAIEIRYRGNTRGFPRGSALYNYRHRSFCVAILLYAYSPHYLQYVNSNKVENRSIFPQS